MAWYAYNGTASRFGATRDRLEQSTSSAEAVFGNYEVNQSLQYMKAILRVHDSSGAVTYTKSSAIINPPLPGVVSIPIGSIPSDVAIPNGGGVSLEIMLTNSGGTYVSASKQFFSPPQTSGVVKAGYHTITIRVNNGHDEDDDGAVIGYWFDIYYGAANTYAPDAICYAETPTVTTTLDALFFGAGL